MRGQRLFFQCRSYINKEKGEILQLIFDNDSRLYSIKDRERITILIFFLIRPGIVKLQIAISPVLVGPKFPSGDQIQGLDTSYPNFPNGVMFTQLQKERV